MSECECPIAGWCDRHGISKSTAWHRLCQTRDSYRKAWDDGRGPGQPRKPLTPEQQERQQRVQESRQRTERLIGWLTFFRLPGDAGIGDTAHRLNKRSCKSPDAHAQLKRLLTMCSCSRADAVVRLNKEHPYE